MPTRQVKRHQSKGILPSSKRLILHPIRHGKTPVFHCGGCNALATFKIKYGQLALSDTSKKRYKRHFKK